MRVPLHVAADQPEPLASVVVAAAPAPQAAVIPAAEAPKLEATAETKLPLPAETARPPAFPTAARLPPHAVPPQSTAPPAARVQPLAGFGPVGLAQAGLYGAPFPPQPAFGPFDMLPPAGTYGGFQPVYGYGYDPAFYSAVPAWPQAFAPQGFGFGAIGAIGTPRPGAAPAANRAHAPGAYATHPFGPAQPPAPT